MPNPQKVSEYLSSATTVDFDEEAPCIVCLHCIMDSAAGGEQEHFDNSSMAVVCSS